MLLPGLLQVKGMQTALESVKDSHIKEAEKAEHSARQALAEVEERMSAQLEEVLQEAKDKEESLQVGGRLLLPVAC